MSWSFSDRGGTAVDLEDPEGFAVGVADGVLGEALDHATLLDAAGFGAGAPAADVDPLADGEAPGVAEQVDVAGRVGGHRGASGGEDPLGATGFKTRH
jgi:hypothetical protein